jgi:hypothetical protein
MMARLILVSMVAVLGISIPTWSEIHLGIKAIHSWTATQLAAWDVPARGDRDPIVLAAPPVERLPAFEPIVADDRASGAAYDLNRAAEGLEMPAQAAMVRRRSREEIQERLMFAPGRMEVLAIPAIDTLESRLVVEWLREGEGPGREAQPAGSPVAFRRSKPVIHPTACRFTPSITTGRLAPRAIESPYRGGASRGGIAARLEPIEPIPDPESGVAWELNRFAEGIEAPVTGPTRLVFSRPDFTPIEPVANPDMSVAGELNRASEGIAHVLAAHNCAPSFAPESASRDSPFRPVPAPPRSSSPPAPSRDLAHAMRLTREAVHAWMNVMSDPSRLHLSAR